MFRTITCIASLALLVACGDASDPGTSPDLLDSDGDGLTDVDEQVLGTDAHDADTDNDGLSDADPVPHGKRPPPLGLRLSFR